MLPRPMPVCLQSPSRTQTSLCLCLLPKKPDISKPALPSQNATPVRISSRYSISTTENNRACSAHVFRVPAARPRTVPVFLQLCCPDDSVQPTGQRLTNRTLGPPRKPRVWDAQDGAQKSPPGQATWGSTRLF